jgi:type 1 fimbriae regulatory protein FimB/type 1 fimbriae regulatory protein FimE
VKVGNTRQNDIDFSGGLGMTTKTLQQSKVGKIQNSASATPNSRKYAAVRTREYLLVSEIEAMRDALKKAGGRHAHRDSTLILLIYRHGLRVAEATALRWEQIDWSGGNLQRLRYTGLRAARIKNSGIRFRRS